MKKIDFKEAVVYQIYPKSFKDSNGDGFGDLNGVIEKLDYLKELGVDYIWITPFYVSPQKDNGYDVEDYYNIDPKFGTMNDFEKLVKEAEKREIFIMLDMVFNHSSTECEWFKKAMSGDMKYKNYYIFKKGNNSKPPTNWISKFGGSAWEYVDKFDEYYLHLYDKTQADLNWDNEDVREEIYNVVNFWIEKGVKGFRFDVINLISKPEVFEDDLKGDGRKYYTDGLRIHEFLKELNRRTFGKYENIITVGEMSSTDIENCIKYTNPEEKELSMVFNFHHLKVDYKNGNKWSIDDFNFLELKDIFDKWQKGIEKGNGWNAVFWCNHDQPRILSRFGDDKNYPIESAKMLGTVIHMLRGTPYIYQGEEFGMTNPYYTSINQYKDVESINYYNILKDSEETEKNILKILEQKSRDNSRTPVQWDNSKNSGFTTGTPWIEIGKNININAQNALEDKNSVFYYYKKLIELRHSEKVISLGDFEIILKKDKNIFAYIRSYKNEKLLVVNNFYGKDCDFKLSNDLYYLKEYKSEVLISNYNDYSKDFVNIKLRPYESIVYKLVK